MKTPFPTLPALLASTLLTLSPGAIPAAGADAREGSPAAADSARTIPAPAVPALPAEPPPAPLLLDPLDLGFGTSVVFPRIPTTRDLSDLAYYPAVQHVVIQLERWPEGWEGIRPMQDYPLPEGADLIVIVPGYPPSRQAAEAWNYLRRPLRIVMLVEGPPTDRGTILELNAIRGLERVIADMANPSRSGFERLQRPLSFRVRKR
ncbi:MAG: hypothetical protein HZA61_06080 [Candidatus Eisenbacteria bacterium]|uniref:Uncharacterized protein n=1 Tax=Eiseniibacteriota bacterium TaxID=2212470 RepID=A0A933SC87_UNCEI|nr:hypothetical protein [Candidatus Eisenbacteria bacterium]